MWITLLPSLWLHESQGLDKMSRHAHSCFLAYEMRTVSVTSMHITLTQEDSVFVHISFSYHSNLSHNLIPIEIPLWCQGETRKSLASAMRSQPIMTWIRVWYVVLIKRKTHSRNKQQIQYSNETKIWTKTITLQLKDTMRLLMIMLLLLMTLVVSGGYHCLSFSLWQCL